jgi:glycosyltransferase involved in cell wall biosynthesis
VLTRDIAVGLARAGLEVYIAMPRKDGQNPVEHFDRITVVSYPSGLYFGLRDAVPFSAIYRMIDADVYHSQEPSLGTTLAQIGEPRKKHVVTFQDPRSIEDWRKQWATTDSVISSSRLTWAERRFLWRLDRECGRAVRRADARYCQAKYVVEKARKLYRLKQDPEFLPNPVAMSPIEASKAEEPTVCFMGRWDPIKRPELFIELARLFPAVRFVLAGDSANDRERRFAIHKLCEGMRNIELTGWIDAPRRDALLDKAWILVNTSTKECLPVSYLEAAAHKCAILSHGNADAFASSFGVWAEIGNLQDFVKGLTFLLEDNRWRALGEEGYEYVKRTHEYSSVIQRHITIYKSLVGSRDVAVSKG